MALKQDGRDLPRHRLARRRAARLPRPSTRRAVDVAFSLEQNQFNGETYLELTLADIRPAAEAALVGLPAAATPEPAL